MTLQPCENPIRVYCKTLGRHVSVPCNHCASCIARKGFSLSSRLDNCLSLYKYKYFFTLTFNDDSLPIARYDDFTDTYVHPFDTDYNGVCYACDTEVVDASFSNSEFLASFRKYGGIPVLSRRFIINFKKRFRKLLSKIFYEPIFLYIVGEYGPTTLRPHYHCILGTNEVCKSDILKSCVRKAWSYYDKTSQKYLYSYGHIDFQRIYSKGSTSYVAQYLSCTANLPPVYSKSLFRPFYQSSPLICGDTARFSRISLESLYNNPTPISLSVSPKDNSISDDVLPSGIINRYFPKCIGFGQLVHCDRIQLYSLFTRVSEFSAKEFACMMVDSFVSRGSDCFSLAYSLCVDDDRFSSLIRLQRLYYVSRRVCLNALKLSVPISLYVEKLELFWSNYELLKLRNFYELQESLLNDNLSPLSLSSLFTLYYDTEDDVRHLSYYLSQFGVESPVFLENLPQNRSFHTLMRKIVLDTTKTKKRNDIFNKRGLRRPSFFNSNSYNLCQKFFQI